MAWRIYPKFDLPKDFELQEDETFTYLLYRGQRIGVFHSGRVTPKAILAVCNAFIAVKDEEVEEEQ